MQDNVLLMFCFNLIVYFLHCQATAESSNAGGKVLRMGSVQIDRGKLSTLLVLLEEKKVSMNGMMKDLFEPR